VFKFPLAAQQCPSYSSVVASTPLLKPPKLKPAVCVPAPPKKAREVFKLLVVTHTITGCVVVDDEDVELELLLVLEVEEVLVDVVLVELDVLEVLEELEELLAVVVADVLVLVLDDVEDVVEDCV